MLYTSPATHRGKGLRDMKVSIIITSYNYEQYIGETLKSIQAQTHRDWEAIVVDDGSTDNSVAIIRRFAEEDPRIHFYRHEGGMNKGIIATNLLALSKCTAELVAFCESDDVLLPESIERRAELMERYPEVVCCFSDITYTNDRLEPIIDRMPRRLPVNRPFDIRFLHTLGYEVHTFSCAMVRKAALEQCDFSPTRSSALDLWIFRQLSHFGPFCYVDEPLTLFRRHGDSLSGDPINNNRAAWHRLMRDNDAVIAARFPTWHINRHLYRVLWRLRQLKQRGLAYCWGRLKRK